jgi:hypothetical protein
MWDDCAWLVAAGVGALEVAAGCSEAPALLVNATAVNAAFDLPSRYERLYSVVAASPAPLHSDTQHELRHCKADECTTSRAVG